VVGLADELTVLGAAGVGRLAGQIAGTGGCVRPVRLTGHLDHVDIATGEIRRAYATGAEPGGVLRLRCNNRRATVCPACSKVYKGDARQIILSGLAGGKSVPSSVCAHPALFVTLTAPSFGAVHSRRSNGKGGPARACRPRRGTCAHGRPAGCHVRHGEDDPRLGEPLCGDCYDYPGHVIWNVMAARLWKATRDALESQLARLAGVSVRGLRDAVRVTFVKVAEMQARGLVHLHAVLRLDGRTDAPGVYAAPPGWATGGLVEEALRATVATVSVACPNPHDPAGPAGAVRWGGQLDVRQIHLAGTVGPDRVANYIAKYATKSVQASGLLDHPVRSLAHLASLDSLRDHARRLVQTCWRLGMLPGFADGLDEAARRESGRQSGLLRWSHQYGFGGHWLTKSRTYSTTFRALRGARRDYRRSNRPGGPVDMFGRADGDPRTVTVGRWAFAGVGLLTVVERFLAGPEPPPGPPRAQPDGRGMWRAES
jgi:hypothetical protein